MIKSVTVTNHLGESVKIELRDPEKSGFLIQDITGLGPSKANINTTEMSTTDGSMYNSARLVERNIVLTLKLLANPTIETTRQLSYKYFPSKKRVRLLIETDNRTCETYGYVESNEPVIFSSSQTTQISLICPDPFFYSAGPDGKTITVFSGIEDLFEFPFEGTEIQMGEIVTSQERTIFYGGDSEIGIVIFIHALGPVEHLTMYNAGTREVMRINTDRLATLTGHGIIAGDDLIISTVKGDKYVMLLRNGSYINILNCFDKDVNWFQLSQGDNVFSFTAESGITNLQFRVENQTIYEGI